MICSCLISNNVRIIKYIALTCLYCHVTVNYMKPLGIPSHEILTHFLLAKPCIYVFSTVVLFIVILEMCIGSETSAISFYTV